MQLKQKQKYILMVRQANSAFAIHGVIFYISPTHSMCCNHLQCSILYFIIIYHWYDSHSIFHKLFLCSYFVCTHILSGQEFFPLYLSYFNEKSVTFIYLINASVSLNVIYRYWNECFFVVVLKLEPATSIKYDVFVTHQLYVNVTSRVNDWSDASTPCFWLYETNKWRV